VELTPRKQAVLKAIVKAYIETGEPVGSKNLTYLLENAPSSATLRNEMSELCELGLLSQPHTSAGRVPSNKAYRLYVDHLMKSVKLSPDERERMHEHLVDKSKRVEGVIRSAANVLSDATKYTSVIVAPKLGTLKIKHVQLVPVAERTALMIIVTSAGIVKDAVIQIPESLDADDLYSISRMLTEKLAEQPLEGVRQAFAELLRDAAENRRLLGDALQVIEKRLESEDQADVIIGGSSNLLGYPEYSDVNKARNFLAVLESKDTIRRLLNRDGGMEITIRIGPENQVPELNDCSIVTASYRVGDHSNGTLGIIGPTRMNYNRVISVLDFMGRALSDVLSEYR